MSFFSIFKKKRKDEVKQHPVGPPDKLPLIQKEADIYEEKEKDKKIADLTRQIEELKTQLASVKTVSNPVDVVKPENKPDPIPDNKTSSVFFEGIYLSQEQLSVANNILDSTNNFFITGKAGTGKSTVLRYLISIIGRETPVCAMTGIAAVSIKGTTIHRLFGFPIGLLDVEDPKLRYMSKDTENLLKKTNRIIIDEISMVRADLMDAIDLRLRVARENDRPFGGCQLICFGDLYQLPPVVVKDEEKKYLDEEYGTPYFFGAPAANTFKVIELKQVFRQSNPEFITALNNIREANDHATEAIAYLNSCAGSAPIPVKPLNVVLTNTKADTINSAELSKLPGLPVIYEAEVGGVSPPKQSEVICAFSLSLKPGASVMLLRNDKDKRYVNGSVGEIVYLKNDEVAVRVNDKIIALEKETWSKYEYVRNEETNRLEQVEVGYVRQFPVKLAYAITTHKSQGQTFDDVVIDFSDRNAFAAGQTYVALSRCRSLEHLHLAQPLKASDVFADESVKHYMNQA